MTLLEDRVDMSLCELKTMRGPLMIISEAIQLEAEDFDSLCGQVETYAYIAQRQIETLDGIIQNLSMGKKMEVPAHEQE